MKRPVLSALSLESSDGRMFIYARNMKMREENVPLHAT